MDFSVRLSKTGGPVFGKTYLTEDTTALRDCVGAPQTPGPLTLTPLAQSHNEDGDGCTDYRELGTDQYFGGLRDPFNPWDFFDPTKDRFIDSGDIQAVVNHYFLGAGDPGYSTNYDRGPQVGPNLWNLGPPDGFIEGGDIQAVNNQYFHNCT